MLPAAPTGLPVLNTGPTFGCTSNCFSLGAPTDVTPSGEITYWSPALNKGGPGGTSDVTQTGGPTPVTLPFNVPSNFFLPNGTGSGDGGANGFQAWRCLSGHDQRHATLKQISWIARDDMAFGLSRQLDRLVTSAGHPCRFGRHLHHAVHHRGWSAQPEGVLRRPERGPVGPHLRRDDTRDVTVTLLRSPSPRPGCCMGRGPVRRFAAGAAPAAAWRHAALLAAPLAAVTASLCWPGRSAQLLLHRRQGHRQQHQPGRARRPAARTPGCRHAAQVPGEAARHGDRHRAAVAQGEHPRRRAGDDVLGGRAAAAQRQVQDEGGGVRKSGAARPRRSSLGRPSAPAQPASAASDPTPAAMKGQARRSSRPATPSSRKDAGSWPKFKASKAWLIRSGRPRLVR